MSTWLKVGFACIETFPFAALIALELEKMRLFFVKNTE